MRFQRGGHLTVGLVLLLLRRHGFAVDEKIFRTKQPDAFRSVRPDRFRIGGLFDVGR